MRTSHGHHIPGTPTDPRPNLVQRCGGVSYCKVCIAEVVATHRHVAVDHIKALIEPKIREYVISRKVHHKTEPFEIRFQNIVNRHSDSTWLAIVTTNIADAQMYYVAYRPDDGCLVIDAYVRFESVLMDL